MKLWNFRGKQNRITEALRVTVPDNAVISLTGSGGKTTLLLAWARELAASGRRTVITTTTHMAHPAPEMGQAEILYSDRYSCFSVICSRNVQKHADQPVLSSGICSKIDDLLNEHRMVMVVSPDPENPRKVISPPEEILDHICKSSDAVLIEADGSRRMPLKWPAPWEPAVPGNTDITVCVAGLSAIGRELPDVMYRSECLPESFRRDTADEILICSVLASAEGGMKGSGGEFRVFLNQADTASLQKSAEYMQKILGSYGILSAWGTFK